MTALLSFLFALPCLERTRRHLLEQHRLRRGETGLVRGRNLFLARPQDYTITNFNYTIPNPLIIWHYLRLPCTTNVGYAFERSRRPLLHRSAQYHRFSRHEHSCTTTCQKELFSAFKIEEIVYVTAPLPEIERMTQVTFRYGVSGTGNGPHHEEKDWPSRRPPSGL